MTIRGYSIRLHRKHTGEEIHLGTVYPTMEAAEAAAEEECGRCNTFDVIPVHEGEPSRYEAAQQARDRARAT